MDSQNVKVYLAISGALIVLLILIIIIPFSKKQPVSSPNPQQQATNLIPTSVETNPSASSGQANNPSPMIVKADFTGVVEEELPPQVLDTSLQKKDLRQKVPLDLSTFSIDFDYGEDKFIVSLKDPKDQAKQEFETWRTNNYPGLGSEQFLLK